MEERGGFLTPAELAGLGDLDEMRAEDPEEMCEEGESAMIKVTRPGASPVELAPCCHRRAAVQRSYALEHVVARRSRAVSRVRKSACKPEILLEHFGQTRSLVRLEYCRAFREVSQRASKFLAVQTLRLLALCPTLPNRCGRDLRLIALGHREFSTRFECPENE